MSPVLGPDETSCYHSLIGVKVGRIDINIEVPLWSSYLAMSRQGHLEVVLHVMDYLKLKHSMHLAFDMSYPNIDQSVFQEYDWTDFMRVLESIPPNVPPLIGKEVDLFF